jgi:hypothetical protein
LLLVDLLEAVLDLQQHWTLIVAFATAQAYLTRYISHDEILSTTPVDVLNTALFKFSAATNVTTSFTHADLLESRDPQTRVTLVCKQ